MRFYINSTAHLLFCFFLACKSHIPQQTSIPENMEKAQQKLILTRSESDSRIVFLRMKIQLIDSLAENYELTMMDVNYAEGVSKKIPFSENEYEPQYIYCELLDSGNNRQEMVKSVNPLNRFFEYTDEGSDEIKGKNVKTDTGEFTVRFNLNNESKYIIFYIVTSQRKLTPIYTAEI